MIVDFALRGLAKCWLPQDQCFSHIYKLMPGNEGNVSVPESDVFYTLNVLLGFSHLRDQGQSTGYDLSKIFALATSRMLILPVPVYAYGMALWTAAELEFVLPAATEARVIEMLKKLDIRSRWSAQDLGIMISGVVAQAAHAPKRWNPWARKLKSFTDQHYSCPATGLYFNAPRGLRRRFASFASAVYLSLAYFHYGAHFGDDQSIERALACVRTLIRCQGPQGEWPWFYDVPTGHVVDMYPIYSVHQHGMAPAMLREAIAHGYAPAREALIRGFMWIFGNNQLQQSMVAATHGMVYRSQERREPFARLTRASRAVGNMMIGHESGRIDSQRLFILRVCRSYELGWILWSFADCDNYPELTFHQALSG